MKLSDYRQTYYEFSGKASEGARTLALSGIAIIWVFAVQGKDGYSLPGQLLAPALLLALSLFLDLMQYVLAAIIWGALARHYEKSGVSSKVELDHSPKLNWPMHFCYGGKLIGVVGAYILLLRFLALRLFASS